MAKAPHADEGFICPLHKVDMSTVCHKCPWWTQVRGKHPQSEEMIDDWKCAISWLPYMLIENAQQSRATGAAVESFRNELVKGVQQSLASAVERRLPDARDNRN
jgi:hypothetical protein